MFCLVKGSRVMIAWNEAGRGPETGQYCSRRCWKGQKEGRIPMATDGSSPVEQEACELSLEGRVDLRLGCERHFWRHRTENSAQGKNMCVLPAD